MRIRNYKTICFILAIIVLLSVMGLDNMKPASSFGCAPMEKIHCYLLSADAANKDAQLCTTEMLEIYDNIVMQQLTSQLFSEDRETSVSLDFLSFNSFFISKGRFCTGLRGIQFLNQKNNEIVITYIHNSDGKKRI